MLDEMAVEKMQLLGIERAKYFAPTAICGYLASLCIALSITSIFLQGMRDALAVTAAALFGLSLSGGLGLLFWRAQQRDLMFLRVTTEADAAVNYAAIVTVAAGRGWETLVAEGARRLDFQTPGTRFGPGERVSISFRGRDVLVASICDPGVGFSLVGRRRCAEHRELVLRTVRPLRAVRP
jgi:hypothetical protein